MLGFGAWEVNSVELDGGGFMYLATNRFKSRIWASANGEGPFCISTSELR